MQGHGADGTAFGRLEAEVVECRRCPRLVDWREEVARRRRAAFRDQTYWGRRCQGSATRPGGC